MLRQPTRRTTLPQKPALMATTAAVPNKPALPMRLTRKVMNALPVRVNRKVGAELVSKFFMPVSHRTLEAWPLTWRYGNGYALVETAELFAVARQKLESATPIRGGRRPAAAIQHAA